MDNLRNFGDQRMQGFCVHCGGPPETRDHAPSKIFLDEPYPSNLPVAPCCANCNEGFSLDEQYVACLVECVLHGSTDPGKLSRKRIAKTLNADQALRARIERSRNEGLPFGEGETIVDWRPEESRVRNVVLKLARCHAAFELNEPKLEEPDHCFFASLTALNAEQRDAFETVPNGGFGVWPEVGSRSMQRLIAPSQSYVGGWLHVQDGRYRYMAAFEGSVMIRGVLSEYLAFQVLWDA